MLLFHGEALREVRFMLGDIIVLVAMVILLLALVVLLTRLVSAVRLQRAWMKGWGGLAEQYGMTFNSGSTRCSLTGMYRGRIIYMMGTFRTGLVIQMATNNYTSNTLVMKARGLSPAPRNPDEATLFAQSFMLESGSPEFLERVFLSHDLHKCMAPLARIPGLVIDLNGEELSLSTPRLYTRSDELLRLMDALSDLAGSIEDVGLTNGALK